MVLVNITVTENTQLRLKIVKISVRQLAIFQKSLNLWPVRIIASTVLVSCFSLSTVCMAEWLHPCIAVNLRSCLLLKEDVYEIWNCAMEDDWFYCMYWVPVIRWCVLACSAAGLGRRRALSPPPPPHTHSPYTYYYVQIRPWKGRAHNTLANSTKFVVSKCPVEDIGPTWLSGGWFSK